MNEQCEGCAFKKGSAANVEPHNNLKASLCASGAVPFYCHANLNWRDPKAHGLKTRREIREGDYRICGGWTREVRRLSKLGYFATSFRRLVLKAYATTGLESLAIFVHPATDADDKRDARRTLADVIRALGKERRKVEAKK